MRYLFYKFLWRTAPYRKNPKFVHLDLELSTKCNLDCIFCYRKQYKYKQKDISEKVFEKALMEAKKYGIKSIKFNWRGEALLNMNFEKYFKLAKKAGFYTMLNTNLAVRLTKEQIEVIALNVDEIKVSFDSSNTQIYQKIRKGADFFRTLTNIDELIACRLKHSKDKIILNRRTSKLTESDMEYISLLSSKVKYDIRPAMERNNEKIYEESEKKERKYCGQPSRRIIIDVDGNCWACCVAYNKDKDLFLGNIMKSSLLEISNNPKRTNLIKNLKQHKYNKTCLECTSYESYK